MTRDELAALIRDIFGLHATAGRVDTLLHAADSYAAASVSVALQPIPQDEP